MNEMRACLVLYAGVEYADYMIGGDCINKCQKRMAELDIIFPYGSRF